MKRVLHISKYYYPFRGGTEQIARDCVRALTDIYEQKVICFNNCNKNEISRVDDIEIIRAGVFATIASQGISLSIGGMLRNVLNSFDPDIIIFHYPNPFVAFYLLKYIPSKTKMVLYWHLDIVRQKILRMFFIGQNKKMVKRADVIIATSPPYVEGSQYLSGAKDKCKIVPNCINEERLRITEEVKEKADEIRKQNNDKIICLAVGRHTAYKGLKYLIRAAHSLDDRFVVYITGKGEETEKLKKEAGNDKKVHFLGVIDDEELKAYMTAMDIFCFPSISKNEAFGLALAEGMYFAKPAVTFSIPGSGVNYVNINGITGIEVPNKDVIMYSEAINTLADNAELRNKMGAAGKSRVEKNFMNKQFYDNIKKVLDDI